MIDNYSRIRSSLFFKDLKKDTFEALFSSGIIKSYTRGDFILHHQDENIPVIFVLRGLLEILRSAPNGREQVIDLARIGDGINLIPALLNERTNRASVRSVTPSEVLVITSMKFNQLIVNYADFAIAVNTLLARRLAHMTELVENLALAPVRSRLAKFLILQASEKTSAAWTQDQIARQIGSVRDVVGRTLRTFELNNLIRLDRNRIILLDKQGLESEAEIF